MELNFDTGPADAKHSLKQKQANFSETSVPVVVVTRDHRAFQITIEANSQGGSDSLWAAVKAKLEVMADAITINKASVPNSGLSLELQHSLFPTIVNQTTGLEYNLNASNKSFSKRQYEVFLENLTGQAQSALKQLPEQSIIRYPHTETVGELLVVPLPTLTHGQHLSQIRAINASLAITVECIQSVSTRSNFPPDYTLKHKIYCQEHEDDCFICRDIVTLSKVQQHYEKQPLSSYRLPG